VTVNRARNIRCRAGNSGRWPVLVPASFYEPQGRENEWPPGPHFACSPGLPEAASGRHPPSLEPVTLTALATIQSAIS
jgi:hypothetical protein